MNWFFGALTLILITLKLIGQIDWAWLWVLAPIWGTALMGILFIILAISIDVWKHYKDRRR